MNTNYSYATEIGVAGGIYDLSQKTVNSRVLDSATGIHYGFAVATGTDKGVSVKAVTSTTTANDIEGVLVYDAGHELNMEGEAVFKDTQSVSVMSHGRVIVAVSSTATAALVYGADVYVVTAYTTKPGDVGKLTDSADPATTKVKINAKFIKAVSNGLAVIELA